MTPGRTVPMWEVSAALDTVPDAAVIHAFYRLFSPVVTEEHGYFVATLPARFHRPAESWASGKGQPLGEFLAALALQHLSPSAPALEAA